jgi:hypothetical protein
MEKKKGLDLLREAFPTNQISKLPKPTKQQTDDVKEDYKKGIRCDECGGWHHPKVVHLDYVGHAALTDRLLDADPEWNWEPLTLINGLPGLDQNGGLWIKLTVCGLTRLGYGNTNGKIGGDAIKELIGDALRNAAMRFGAALELWHKGDLHEKKEETPEINKEAKQELSYELKTAAAQANIAPKPVVRDYRDRHDPQPPKDETPLSVSKLKDLYEYGLRKNVTKASLDSLSKTMFNLEPKALKVWQAQAIMKELK